MRMITLVRDKRYLRSTIVTVKTSLLYRLFKKQGTYTYACHTVRFYGSMINNDRQCRVLSTASKYNDQSAEFMKHSVRCDRYVRKYRIYMYTQPHISTFTYAEHHSYSKLKYSVGIARNSNIYTASSELYMFDIKLTYPRIHTHRKKAECRKCKKCSQKEN